MLTKNKSREEVKKQELETMIWINDIRRQDREDMEKNSRINTKNEVRFVAEIVSLAFKRYISPKKDDGISYYELVSFIKYSKWFEYAGINRSWAFKKLAEYEKTKK